MSDNNGWKRTFDVVVGGWQQLADITAQRAQMWEDIAVRRQARIDYLTARCAKLEQLLAQKSSRTYQFDVRPEDV